MSIVKCENYPELKIFDLGITFIKGIAQVNDSKKLNKLKELNGFGFVFEEITEENSCINLFTKLKKEELEQKALELEVDLSDCKNNAEKAAKLFGAIQGKE